MLKHKLNDLLIKRRCAVCQSETGYLCDSCCEELSASHGIFATRRLSATMFVTSLFHYEGVMRDLLLRAKIESSFAATQALLKLLRYQGKRIPAR